MGLSEGKARKFCKGVSYEGIYERLAWIRRTRVNLGEMVCENEGQNKHDTLAFLE